MQGIVRPTTERFVLDLIDDLHRQQSIDGIIVDGTELSLLIADDVVRDLPVLDTTSIHTDAAVDAFLAG